MQLPESDLTRSRSQRQVFHAWICRSAPAKSILPAEIHSKRFVRSRLIDNDRATPLRGPSRSILLDRRLRRNGSQPVVFDHADAWYNVECDLNWRVYLNFPFKYLDEVNTKQTRKPRGRSTRGDLKARFPQCVSFRSFYNAEWRRRDACS